MNIMHCALKNVVSTFFAITSSTVNRFRTSFHHWKQQWIYNILRHFLKTLLHYQVKRILKCCNCSTNSWWRSCAEILLELCEFSTDLKTLYTNLEHNGGVDSFVIKDLTRSGKAIATF